METLLKTIGMMYVTLLPTILAGIFNMIWIKLPILKVLKKPIDGGRDFADGKRIFGDNKTWKGIAGYVLLNIVFTVLWGLVCRNPSVASWDFFYLEHDSTLNYNLLVGSLLGLGYSLFELPNSFLKRRLDITPGKTIKGFWKVFFIFLDQADSIFGVAIVVWIFHDIGILLYLGFVAVGAVTHIVLNMLLYFAHLRKNMF
ncbi:MAG: CDP-archaeol synthase [Clostridiales bacterium]|nr:CDP-archaeol synthase [Clostridiales bacterium]